jgi:ribonucleoside-diphosphate reductase alpha chain
MLATLDVLRLPTTRDRAPAAAPATPTARVRPARKRPGHIHEFDINGLAAHLTITELPDGRPGEIFLKVGKQGSTLTGLCEALSLMTSLALQHQVPLVEIVRRLINMRLEPTGTTGDPEIPTTTSLADYLGRRLAADYLNPDDGAELGLPID